MLRRLSTLGAAIATSAIAFATVTSANAKDALILVQLNEYAGDEAYFALYLVKPDGKYDHTLWLSGPEKVWWPQTARWWGYFSRNPQDVDAITGASTPSGGRAVMHIDLDPALIDSGYKLRIETSVDQNENYQDDAEVDLTSANQRVKTPGTGYVRYIRYKL